MFTEIRRIKQKHTRALFERGGVVAVGVGYKETNGVATDEPSIIVSVVKKLPTIALLPRDLIPQSLDGVPTDVRETGTLRALQTPTDRWRPAPGGVSIGHVNITAGTLGCLVEKDGQLFILSNNHVLANMNDGQQGDPILQPGPHDGGQVDNDTIATLEDFVPISFGEATCPIAGAVTDVLNALSRCVGSAARLGLIRQAENLVDAAIARPVSDDLVERRILGIGEPTGMAEGTLGLAIQKSGRTTGVNSGQITQIDVTALVGYGLGKSATFTDQLMAGAMSQGGDSGSAVLDLDNHVVGLLFAGSYNTTLFNRIQNVADALGVSV